MGKARGVSRILYRDQPRNLPNSPKLETSADPIFVPIAVYFLRPLRFLRLIFLLPHQPHIHRGDSAALGADHDWVDFHVGEMISMRGEDF